MFQVELICSDGRCAAQATLLVDDLDELDLRADCECGHGLVTLRVEGFEPVFAAA